MSGSKIIEGLRDAVAGNFASVTIEGQTWVRRDWRPIETAPKDGSHVLLAITGDDPPGYGYVAEGYYDMDSDRGWFHSNTHWTDAHSGQLFPSHWMSLPAPPSEGRG